MIRQNRRKKELSQAQLAKKIGIDATFLSRIETGKARISVRHAPALAKALDLDEAEVIQAIEASAPPVSGRGVGKTPAGSEGGNVAVVAEIAAEEGRYTLLEESPLVEAPSGLKSADPNLLAVRISGNGYSPLAEDGDILVISPARAYLPNDLVFLRTTDNRGYVGKIQFEGDQVVLLPVQPKQAKIRRKKGEIESLSRVVLRYVA